MENLSRLESLIKFEEEQANFFYKKAYIENYLNKFIEDFRFALYQYCMDQDLVYINGIPMLKIDVFPQQNFEYNIGIYLTPHENAEKFDKKHKISKKIVNNEMYSITKQGIDELINDNKHLFKELRKYNVNAEDLYSLVLFLDDAKKMKIRLTHITEWSDKDGF